MPPHDDRHLMPTRLVNLIAVSFAAVVLALVMHVGLLEIAAEPAQQASAQVGIATRTPEPSAPPARGARSLALRVAAPVTLPVDSPWALPPMLVLQSRTGGRASPALRRWVLHLDRLALSPAARRSIQRGAASSGALKLLAAFPRTGGPLLVLAVDGRQIRAQAPTLWMTRKALRSVPDMPAKLRPQRLLLEPFATDRADLAGPPRAKPGQLRTLVGIYRTAGYQYGIDWRVLAAINRVETNFGHNTNVSSAGAVGWMQFLPSTWRRWGTDASGDGVADPYDPQDAIFSAARYLDAAGRARTCAARSSPTTTPTGTSTRSSRSPLRSRRATAARGWRRRRRRARCGRPPTARTRARRRPASCRGAPRADAARRPPPSGSARARALRARGRRARPPSPVPRARARGCPRSAGSTARSERSSRTSSARHAGHGRSAGRSTAGPLQWPQTGQP